MIKRFLHFFRLWGMDYYGKKIDISFAWELARVFAEHDKELSRWMILK